MSAKPSRGCQTLGVERPDTLVSAVFWHEIGKTVPYAQDAGSTILHSTVFQNFPMKHTSDIMIHGNY